MNNVHKKYGVRKIPFSQKKKKKKGNNFLIHWLPEKEIAKYSVTKKKADYIILSTLTMKFSRHDFRIIIKTKTKKEKKEGS